MQNFIDYLWATHTSAKMINHTRERGGLVRKDPVTTAHPLVRRHPVTGKKAIFLNGEFVTGIEGLKVTESKMLMDFLINHMVTGHDFQCRVKWQPRSVVIFDNRSILRKLTPFRPSNPWHSIGELPLGKHHAAMLTLRPCNFGRHGRR